MRLTRMERMRAYSLRACCGDGHVVYVADTAREAKVLGFGNDNLYEYDWIDIRVNWRRDVDVTGLPKGEIDLMEGLKRGAYSYIFGIPCPMCGKDTWDNHIFIGHCDYCGGDDVE